MHMHMHGYQWWSCRFGCKAEIFNAGKKRRDIGKAGVSSDFYNTENKEAHNEKERIAMATLGQNEFECVELASSMLSPLIRCVL